MIKILSLLAAGGILVFTSCTGGATAKQKKVAEEKGSDGVRVQQQWDMPADLQEISGIVWEGENKVACINDEEGVVYRYDLAKSAVYGEIPFGPAGDYEDLTRVGEDYWIMRSDARLTRLQPGGRGAPVTEDFDVPVRKKEDIETLFYDAAGARLLFMNKSENRKSGGSALSIWAFDLRTKTAGEEPVAVITTDELDLSGGKADGKTVTILPSALAIHPQTGDYYILNGPHAGLLIAGRDGQAKRYIRLDRKVFPQPEGITFSPSGDLYLSSEGGKGAGVIARVAL